MSVKFDQSGDVQALEAVYPVATAPGGIRLTSVPVSITLWLYLENAPGTGETHTIWWFGEADDGANYIVLEATENQQGGFDLAARAVGQGTIGPISETGLALETWHCVSVVLSAQGQSNFTLTLYVDNDQSAASTSGSNTGFSLSDWDTFSLARNRSGGAENTGEFSFEHAAIWSEELGPLDNANMFVLRVPPADGGTGLTVGKAPDFSYWYCTAHSRSGIRVRTRDDVIPPGIDTWPRDGGEFFNETTPIQDPPLPPEEYYPFLRIPNDNAAAMWSANTPVMRYAVSQKMAPIVDRKILPPSRLQPHFFFFSQPRIDDSTSDEDVRSLAFYSDPNMSKFGQADYRGANQLWPPVPITDRQDYFPEREIALSAKRLADWYELMGFTSGVGTGTDNQYAGCLYVRGVGLGGVPRNRAQQVRGLEDGTTFVRTFTGMVETYKGTDNEIPLEMHPDDWVLGNDSLVRAPWASWFRESGSKLVREYMDHFWEALKWELDDRGLCYPLRIHFDYEGWPRGREQLAIVDLNGTETQVGCWPDVASNSKAGTEDLLNYGGSTINSLLGSVTWDATKAMYTSENNDFQQWWDGHSVAIRMQAVAESVFADLSTYFPETKWGNYYAFVADDPNFKYPDGGGNGDVQRWFNTPVGNASLVIPGDFSTPILYANGNQLEGFQGDFEERIGYSYSEVVRDFQRMRLDAVFNARSAKPVVPTMENVGRLLTNSPNELSLDDALGDYYFYNVTAEDLSSLMSYAWQRGANEFVMFTFAPDIEVFGPNIAVAAWLRDWVHAVPQMRRDRVGRVSRLGRRAM